MNTIRELWDGAASKYAGLPAVAWLDKKDIKKKSYGELDASIKAIRKGLKAEGFEGVHIALIGTASVNWIEAYLGITTGNNVAVPLDAGLPAEDLAALLNDSDAEALFLFPRGKALAGLLKAQCPKIRRIWLLQEEAEEGFETISDLSGKGENGDDAPGRSADEIVTLIYTSGTTGKSKGVMLTQYNLAQNVESVPVSFEPGCTLLSVLPVHHAFCLVMDWLKGFSLGATLYINDSLLHMVRNIGMVKPQVLLMVPLMIETIGKRLAAIESDLPKPEIAKQLMGENLEYIFSGGAHLDPAYISLFEEYGIKVCEGYGMSECSPTISSNGQTGNRPGSVGKVLANMQVRFVDGEIQVKGSNVMKGYYKMPKETEEAFVDGWLRTGDLGCMDEDGYLYITGRLKNLIILSNGENVSPEEIENTMLTNDLVGEIIISGEENGLAARIYPDPDVVEAKGLSPEEVQAQLQAILDDYNKTQPLYRAITALTVRKYPFVKNATKKIVRAKMDVDEAPEEG